MAYARRAREGTAAMRPSRGFAAILGLVVILTLVTWSPAGAQAVSDPTDMAPGVTTQLTLITGDTVLLEEYPDGRQAVSIDAAPRASGEPIFETLEMGGEVYVLPSDAARLVPEMLDRELFNVTKLVDYGYVDGVPVIVDADNTRRGAVRQPAVEGLTVTSELESIGAVAATVEPGGDWWEQAGTAPNQTFDAGSSASIERVWLDAQVEATLDESAPLVGAPQARDIGLDGTGTTVAVLDTGIDDQHPDLAGKVVASANFTDSNTSDDLHGHGTHVSGIVAGTGAASGGSFTGVAHGAELMNGKVLGDDAVGQFSWVIEGIEWAAEGGADVINMSLGGDPTDGTDPLSQAANTLTEQHNVLFVVAAGNSGSADQTVATPAAADAALAVGSVTKSEFLAFSSSRGPRKGDFAIKPDVTAPGVLIASARAEGTSIGIPAENDAYRATSGTSMASPHVAGAAAILRQAEPQLTPAEVKARLVTTAVPRATNDVYEQGGGRIDVPAALDVPVEATPATVNLGYFRWPQDNVEPVSADVTYTNLTDDPLTLDLVLGVESRDGVVPSEGMLSVSPNTLTLAPGEVGVATVTVDVTGGEHGLYGGYLVAESGGEVVTRTPVGFYHESEHYDLTVTGVARDGSPASAPSSFDVVNIDNRRIFTEGSVGFDDGTGTVRVPPGNYSVMSAIFTGPEGATTDCSMVGEPEVEVTGPTAVTLDAGDAAPITIDTPDHPDAIPVQHWALDYRRTAAEGGSFFHRYLAPVSAFPNGMYAAATDPVTLGSLTFTHRSRHGAGEPATPYLYDLVFSHADGIPTDPGHTAETESLARVDNGFASDSGDHIAGEIRHFWTPGLAISSAEFVPLPMLAERVEYLVPGVARYQQSIFAQGTELGRMFEPITEYAAGEQRDQTWHGGPRRSGMREGGPFDISRVVTRLADTLRMPLMEWADTHPSHWSPGDTAVDTTAFRLFQDDELIFEDLGPPTGVPVSPDSAVYRIEFDVARDAEWWTTSTQTSTAWTVHSERPPGPSFVVLPLVMVDYDADLDLRNTSPHPRDRSGPPVIEIQARHQAGADGPPIAGARLWTSYDDGETWRRRAGRGLGDGRFEFRLDARDPLETTGFVSLRVEAWDSNDNRIEQEIIRAWRLAER
ncbi:MAG: S8 family serine peptidase [Acidimicrobiia bacterium]|nr:S8 family serine peptidase [Acidimicrobiia bacterium]